MAKAQGGSTRPAEFDEVTLTLTLDEAKTLQLLCGRIGGNADVPGPRMDADRIAEALTPVVGASYLVYQETKAAGRKIKGYINFSDADGTFPDGGMTEFMGSILDMLEG